MVTLHFGITAADLQTAVTTLADCDPAMLFTLLGLDQADMLDVLDADPDGFEVMLAERLDLFAAGYPTWLPRPDTDD